MNSNALALAVFVHRQRACSEVKQKPHRVVFLQLVPPLVRHRPTFAVFAIVSDCSATDKNHPSAFGSPDRLLKSLLDGFVVRVVFIIGGFVVNAAA